MSKSSVAVIGLSHHTAPVEVRERMAFGDAAIEDALRQAVTLGDGEAMIISTCNRVEIYLTAPDGSLATLRDAALPWLATTGKVEAASIAPLLFTHHGEAAVRHLFRVASSLDSMVVGEPQILGQVKTAYEAAVKAGVIGPSLGRVVPRAFTTAKRVRSETQIARASASVASAAVELARHIFGKLDGRDVLIVGAGKMAALAARHLRAAGCKRLLVVNRTFSRAEELAATVEGEAQPWEQLESLLGKVDIVLCSTGAQRPVIGREPVVRAMKARRGRWLCFIDIAVPRDVEPEVADIENVYLYDVDGLSQLVDDHLADRRREAASAERIIDEELKRWAEAERSLGVVPTIKALRERFLNVARVEVERCAGRLSSDQDRKELQALADAIVNKLLHAPLTALKREAESESLIAAARALFALTDGADAPAPGEAARAVEKKK